MAKALDPSISVIIPVYKAEKYIEICVNSILQQSYRNYELILVDDGSPDRSGEICDILEKRDERIRVIHKVNGGAASARNAGLDVARGDYIAFVDGDDFVHPQYLQVLLTLLENSNADFSMCHYQFFSGQMPDLIPLSEAVVTQRTELSGPKLLDEFHKHYRRVSLISLCMKLFRREVFNDLRIPEGYIEEDSMSLPLILERAKCIAKSEEKLYYWRITPGSVTRSGFSEKSFAYIEVSRFQAEFFVQRRSKEQHHFKREFLQRTLFYYYKICDEKPDLMKAYGFFMKRYRQLFLRYILAREISVRERAAYIIFFFSPKKARRFYEQVHGGHRDDS